jgi:hypothetical protein
MKTSRLYLSLLFLMCSCLLLTGIAFAQGSNVKLRVTFDNPVHVGNDHVLRPGTYIFHLVEDQTDRPVFRVQTPEGKNLTFTSDVFSARKSSSIPAAGEIPSTTRVMLENVDGTYYLHRISLGGQNRGFEFELPENVQSKVNNNTHVVIQAAGGEAQ